MALMRLTMYTPSPSAVVPPYANLRWHVRFGYLLRNVVLARLHNHVLWQLTLVERMPRVIPGLNDLALVPMLHLTKGIAIYICISIYMYIYLSI